MTVMMITMMMMMMVMVLIVNQQERFLCRDDYLALLRGPEFAYSDDEEEVACALTPCCHVHQLHILQLLLHIINFL